MRALVTGSAGFVGRHITKELAVQGYDIVEVDIKEGIDCREWFKTHLYEKFDLVVHCAAVVGGRTMIDGAPLLLAVEDLTIDAEMFKWAMQARPGRIIYFSSSAAYPVGYQQAHGSRLLTEADLDMRAQGVGMPDATYGWVKVTGERLAAEANSMGITTHVFRPFSGYGADQDLTYPFPSLIKRVMETDPEEILDVWGDASSTRDWVHISDVVGCVMAAIEQNELGPINICTGISTSFADLVWHISDALGRPRPAVRSDKSKPMGVFHRVGDPTKMSKIYGPKTTLMQGILDAVNANLNG